MIIDKHSFINSICQLFSLYQSPIISINSANSIITSEKMFTFSYKNELFSRIFHSKLIYTTFTAAE